MGLFINKHFPIFISIFFPFLNVSSSINVVFLGIFLFTKIYRKLNILCYSLVFAFLCDFSIIVSRILYELKLDIIIIYVDELLLIILKMRLESFNS